MKVKIVDRATRTWNEAADLAHDAYLDAFAAETQPDPDRFIVAWPNRKPSTDLTWRPPSTPPVASACAGMTFASDRPFFSEHYLDESGACCDLIDGAPVCGEQQIVLGGEVVRRRRRSQRALFAAVAALVALAVTAVYRLLRG